MTRRTPDHGTPARYLGTRTGNRPKCRCRRCIDAHTRACQLRELAHLNGVPPRVPSGPVQQHVLQLLNAGMSCTQISIAAGVSKSSVINAAQGKNLHFNRAVAEKILAVLPRIVRPTDRLPAHGTRRRLQALYSMGHGPKAIAEATALTDGGIRNILYGSSDVVTAATYRAVRSAYRDLARVAGSSPKARLNARANGWHGPAAWGDDIDNPNAVPEITPAYAAPAGNGRDSMRMAELEHLLSLGESEAAIAKQMGASEVYIHDLATVIRSRKKPAGYSTAA